MEATTRWKITGDFDPSEVEVAATNLLEAVTNLAETGVRITRIRSVQMIQAPEESLDETKELA